MYLALAGLGEFRLDALRLEDQISWYDRKISYNQTAFKSLKVPTISSVAVIPVFSIFPVVRWVTAVAGIVIAVSEGVQQIDQSTLIGSLIDPRARH